MPRPSRTILGNRIQVKWLGRCEWRLTGLDLNQEEMACVV